MCSAGQQFMAREGKGNSSNPMMENALTVTHTKMELNLDAYTTFFPDTINLKQINI